MANRYWVGGTASWDATAGTKWSTTSGGGGGSAVPTSSDDVFFDANSGAVTVTTGGASINCLNLSFSGFTGTFAGSTGLFCAGTSIIFSSSTTYTSTSSIISTNAGTLNYYFNGASTLFTISKVSGTGVITFNDTVTCGIVSINAGTLNTNNYAINCISFNNSGATAITQNLGTSVITMSGTTGLNLLASNLTMNASTATFVWTDSTSSNKNANGAGKTYGTWTFSGTGTGSFLISGANTITTLQVLNPQNKVLVFQQGVTQTISSVAGWSINGNTTGLVRIESSSAGSSATISISSGVLYSRRLQIKDITATGGATWNAVNSISTSGNTGWNFITSSPFVSNLQISGGIM